MPTFYSSYSELLTGYRPETRQGGAPEARRTHFQLLLDSDRVSEI